MKSSYKIALAIAAVACAAVIVITLSNNDPTDVNGAPPAAGDQQAGVGAPPPVDDGQTTPRPSLTNRGGDNKAEDLSSSTLDLLNKLDNLDSGTLQPPVDDSADDTTLGADDTADTDTGNALTLGDPPAGSDRANDLLRGTDDTGSGSMADTTGGDPYGDVGKGGSSDFGKGGSSAGDTGTTDTGTTDTGGQDTITPPPPADDNNTAPARTHTVQEGEVLATIAEHYFGSQRYWVHIAQANPTMDPNRIRPGQVLRLPSDLDIKRTETRNQPPAAPEGADAGQIIYTVQTGDTLSTIAQQYYGSESKWAVIHEANRKKIGSDPDRIRLGMKLIIPPAPGNSR